MRPLLTISVGVNDKRQLVLSAKRHGIDSVELWAAAACLGASLWSVVARLDSTGKAVPADAIAEHSTED